MEQRFGCLSLQQVLFLHFGNVSKGKKAKISLLDNVLADSIEVNSQDF